MKTCWNISSALLLLFCCCCLLLLSDGEESHALWKLVNSVTLYVFSNQMRIEISSTDAFFPLLVHKENNIFDLMPTDEFVRLNIIEKVSLLVVMLLGLIFNNITSTWFTKTMNEIQILTDSLKRMSRMRWKEWEKKRVNNDSHDSVEFWMNTTSLCTKPTAKLDLHR